MKKTVAFALNTYMPRTYTWVYNQLKFIKSLDILVLANMLHPDHVFFPLENHKLFSFPGYKVLTKPSIPRRIMRRCLRFLLIDSRLDLLVFAWKAKKMMCSLIHAHFADIGWKFIPVAKMLNIPLVVSFYGFDYDLLPNTQRVWKKRYQKLFKSVDLFLTEGSFGRDMLIKKGVGPEKVKVHHLGVDVDSIPFAIRHLKQGESLKLVQVANFVEKKGHQIVIEAMRILKEKYYINNISLTLIGDGPLKEKMISLTNQYGLTEHISFINHIPYESLHGELLKYHIFIHPSITTADGDCEGGAPVVLLDAEATGMPIIATLHCDIPEEVIHGQTGLLVPEGDAQALADAVFYSINHPHLISKYGEEGRKHVEENYSGEKQSQQLLNLYSTLINRI